MKFELTIAEKNDEVEQAETYLDLIAECPHCGEPIQVEWVDETVDGLEEGHCDFCDEDFTYCHPLNNYGLAK